MSKVFYDTNMLVYMLDKRDTEKNKVARKLFEKDFLESNSVISMQVIQEFYVVCRRKLSIEPLRIKELLHYFSNQEIVTTNLNLIYEAIDLQIVKMLSFRDALIVIAAESANCTKLYTEDMSHGEKIRGVEVINPFIL